MNVLAAARAWRWMSTEALATERRLRAVPAFSATIPMVADAVPSLEALAVADRAVATAKASLQLRLRGFVDLLSAQPPSPTTLVRLHRRWIVLRSQFDQLLSTVDVFADALTQRAEHGTGTLLRGLDRLALDGLRTTRWLYRSPPLVCYLDAGLGGAIRRAFTQLPDGSANGVALVRVPRERLFGAALASVLHEVGHQGAALLDLVPAYQKVISRAAVAGQLTDIQAVYWLRKISEALPDAWALCKLGPTASIGLFGTFGRSPRFTFHDNVADPHPMPWIRALLSVELGASLLPDPVWSELRDLWLTLYPRERAPHDCLDLIESISPSIPVMAGLLARSHLRALRGSTLGEALGAKRVHPATLASGRLPGDAREEPADSPCTAVAAIGLARYRGRIRPAEEHDRIRQVLTGHASTAAPTPARRFARTTQQPQPSARNAVN
ncbi:MAG TPA: hypothetical protein VGF45_05360 [Polyangia bacterium]